MFLLYLTKPLIGVIILTEDVVILRNDYLGSILSKSERAVFDMRLLYEGFGYRKYKMKKFEEYDLYLQNKSFLKGGSIITFTDFDGRLLALKPDVTLSIAKNLPQSDDAQKVYYTENVYRESASGGEYKEIMQAGLEYIGELDSYAMAEVLLLALKSLELMGDNYVLDVSHMGIINGLLSELPEDKSELSEKLVGRISRKDSGGVRELCAQNNLSGEFTEGLAILASAYGDFEKTLEGINKIAKNDEVYMASEELSRLYEILKECGVSQGIRLDFSVVNDLSYYNGIIFRGFLKGVPGAVLSGGRYDRLLHKLGKKGNAAGFAVYLDLLEKYLSADKDTDADILLLYDENTNPAQLMRETLRLSEKGFRVRAQKNENTKVKSGETIRFSGGKENA